VGKDSPPTSARAAYSVSEVAAMCGIDDKPIRLAILEGRLRAVRLQPDNPHSKWLIPADALRQWLEGGTS
jgi:excisionase family DNA binding protein